LNISAAEQQINSTTQSETSNNAVLGERQRHIYDALVAMPQPSEDVEDKVRTFYQLHRIGEHPTSHFAPRKYIEDIERDLCQPTVCPPNA